MIGTQPPWGRAVPCPQYHHYEWEPTLGCCHETHIVPLWNIRSTPQKGAQRMAITDNPGSVLSRRSVVPVLATQRVRRPQGRHASQCVTAVVDQEGTSASLIHEPRGDTPPHPLLLSPAGRLPPCPAHLHTHTSPRRERSHLYNDVIHAVRMRGEQPRTGTSAPPPGHCDTPDDQHNASAGRVP